MKLSKEDFLQRIKAEQERKKKAAERGRQEAAAAARQHIEQRIKRRNCK
jgi:hypothetical protein